jgi:hypothetical protein
LEFLSVNETMLVLLTVLLLFVGFVGCVAGLRDWLDNISSVHLLASALASLSCILPLLLLLDCHHTLGATDPTDPISSSYEAVQFALFPLLFAAVPVAWIVARRKTGRQPLACFSCGLGALLGICLSSLSPLLALLGPEAPLVGESWVAKRLARLQGLTLPRALFDGPHAACLLMGALSLAMHGAEGAVALPRLVAPPPRGSRHRGVLTRLRAAIEATQEERRALASAFDMRGLPMRREQRERQQELEARERRLLAQVDRIGSARSWYADACGRMRHVRSLLAMVLSLSAAFFGVALAASLIFHAANSDCGVRCGFLLPPFEPRGTLDAAAATDAATDAAVAAASTVIDAANTATAAATAAAARDGAAAAAAAATAAATVASAPLDAVLLFSTRTAPLDSCVLVLLLALVISWTVAASSSSDAAHDSFPRSCCCDGDSQSLLIRCRGSSAAAILLLSVRISLTVIAFSSFILVLAPVWTHAIVAPDKGSAGAIVHAHHSVAATTILVLSARLPWFGLAWYTSLCFFAASLLCRMGHVAARMLQGRGRGGGASSDPDEIMWGDNVDSADEERMPLRAAARREVEAGFLAM